MRARPAVRSPDGNSGLRPESFQEGASALSAARQFQVFSSWDVGVSQRTSDRLWASSGNLPLAPLITGHEELSVGAVAFSQGADGKPAFAYVVRLILF